MKIFILWAINECICVTHFHNELVPLFNYKNKPS